MGSNKPSNPESPKLMSDKSLMPEKSETAQTDHQSASNLKRNNALQKVNLVSVLVDLLLSLGKTLAGFLFHSQALIVDGVHSFSDLVTDGFVVWITQISHQAPDEDHPYGHARFETAGTIVFGLILVAVAIGFFIHGIQSIWQTEDFDVPEWPALIVAIIAVIAKEILYFYTLKIAKIYNSPLLHANAWHHRSDVLSTIVVIVGITGALSGAAWLDPLAAIVVAVMIAWVGVILIWKSIQELVDTSPYARNLDCLRETISKVDGVKGIHSLRSRRMGPNTLLDVHIQVPSFVSVSEGHQIGDWVSQSLLQNFDDITEVTIHIDPEDDLVTPKQQLLPLRNEVMEQLIQSWKELEFYRFLSGIDLHYLHGKIHVDVIFPLEDMAKSGLSSIQMTEFMRQKAEQLAWLGKIRILYSSRKDIDKFQGKNSF